MKNITNIEKTTTAKKKQQLHLQDCWFPEKYYDHKETARHLSHLC